MSHHRLLIVEDEPEIATLVSEVATEMGFIAHYASGLNAIHTYRQFQPHLIVLDLVMPEIDGLEFLQFLERQGTTARVIILSGSGNNYRRIAENLGASSGILIEANLAKPFRIEMLRQALAKAASSIQKGQYLLEEGAQVIDSV